LKTNKTANLYPLDLGYVERTTTKEFLKLIERNDIYEQNGLSQKKLRLIRKPTAHYFLPSIYK